jgi:hypothetical protein
MFMPKVNIITRNNSANSELKQNFAMHSLSVSNAIWTNFHEMRFYPKLNFIFFSIFLKSHIDQCPLVVSFFPVLTLLDAADVECGETRLVTLYTHTVTNTVVLKKWNDFFVVVKRYIYNNNSTRVVLLLLALESNCLLFDCCIGRRWSNSHITIAVMIKTLTKEEISVNEHMEELRERMRVLRKF